MSGGLFGQALLRETGRPGTDPRPSCCSSFTRRRSPGGRAAFGRSTGPGTLLDVLTRSASRASWTPASGSGPDADRLVVVRDLLVARRARCIGVGVLSGGYGREELERAGAYWVYEDPADLMRHLDEIGVRLVREAEADEAAAASS